ncbi:enoyl-CoA hydratase [Methylobacterium nonmethylotrophicum]|uniref:Enoyl-CoA hydratase n=1 Tax=Methylobacterium nonmethylotrophicum TaxID=1141884 RepID=A0A4Z0NFU5_9HYPH|nr:enoyl-CoA hydratase [Methylobacterium nonmethylotrophicum]TGD95121.1 enoyl-CoA hydratase [Methylobacterium nonmethylotrophicum]
MTTHTRHADGKILAEKAGPVGRLIFNNPEKRNAVSYEMWEAAAAVLQDFAADPAVRVVVVTGAGGKAFVSGADISKFENERAEMEEVRRYGTMTEQVYAGLHAFPKPTIAAIRGFCIGGGLGLAVACDIRLCTTASRFALPAARLGLGYGFAPLRRLADVVGLPSAKEIVFTGRQFSAEEARAMGLAHRAVPDEDLDGLVEEYVAQIGANAPLTVGAAKYILGEVAKDEAARDLDEAKRRVEACFSSEDYREGRRAFMEKRAPRFTGR